MTNTLITAAVATGERINIIPYIAIGAAVVVLAVLLLLPKLKKKPTDKGKNDADE